MRSLLCLLCFLCAGASGATYHYTLVQKVAPNARAWSHGVNDSPVVIRNQFKRCSIQWNNKNGDKINGVIAVPDRNGIYQALYGADPAPEELKQVIPWLAFMDGGPRTSTVVPSTFGHLYFDYQNNQYVLNRITIKQAPFVAEKAVVKVLARETVEATLSWTSENISGTLQIILTKIDDTPCTETTNGHLRRITWSVQQTSLQQEVAFRKRRSGELANDSFQDLLASVDAHKAAMALDRVRHSSRDRRIAFSKMEEAIRSQDWRPAVFIAGILASDGSERAQVRIARLSADKHLPSKVREDFSRVLFLVKHASQKAVRLLVSDLDRLSADPKLTDARLLTAASLASVCRKGTCVSDVSKTIYMQSVQATQASDSTLARTCLGAAKNLGKEHATRALLVLAQHSDTSISKEAKALATGQASRLSPHHESAIGTPGSDQ